MNILVTGGCGFIGSHVVDRLVDEHNVTVLDNLETQVHQSGLGYRNKKAVYLKMDVCRPLQVRHALEDHRPDVVIHLAAQVGVGQSMYSPTRYALTNCVGTAVLLEELAKKPIKRLIVASSMSCYGEGMTDEDGRPIGTPEYKPFKCESIYAVTKRDQEEMCLSFGKAYKVPTLALRLFNTYGSRQSLSNPYTGVAAIFASRLLNDQPPFIYEDGLQMRDFVHVSDVADAFKLAVESDVANAAINIGSGDPHSIFEIYNTLANLLGKDIAPTFVPEGRAGDVRHCFADISKARKFLGYDPKVRFLEGAEELVSWIEKSNPSHDDHVERAQLELRARNLA